MRRLALVATASFSLGLGISAPSVWDAVSNNHERINELERMSKIESFVLRTLIRRTLYATVFGTERERATQKRLLRNDLDRGLVGAWHHIRQHAKSDAEFAEFALRRAKGKLQAAQTEFDLKYWGEQLKWLEKNVKPKASGDEFKKLFDK